MGDTDRFVLVEGPAWGDAKFYGEWLLAAGQAETFWKEARKDPLFAKQVERLQVVYIPDFGIAASITVMRLEEYCTSLVLDLDSYDGEDFAMMVGMGFFVRTHQSYQMTIPPCLTAKKVRAAVIQYANTEDEEYMLHPEFLITS
jgi:hypothetical protein